MKIYLVRHGLTAWNKRGRYAGWSDVPLSPLGKEQAESLSRYFSDRGPFTLYSSDLIRANSTAEIIGKNHGVTPVVLPAFRELFFGDWEGKTYAELAKTHQTELVRWFSDPFSHGPPGGETVNQLKQRVWTDLEKVAAAHNSKDTVILISHSGPIRTIIHRCLGLKLEKFWDIPVDNASISLLIKENQNFQVVFQNSYEHLV